MKIQVDFNQVIAKNQEAFRDMAEIMAGEFTKAISDPVWDWPTGGKRDIIDTGRLRISQLKSVTANTASYAWPVEYAAAVHNGAILKNGSSLPPRPWTELAVQRKDPAKVFASLSGGVLYAG